MAFLYILYASLAFLALVLAGSPAWTLQTWEALQQCFSVCVAVCDLCHCDFEAISQVNDMLEGGKDQDSSIDGLRYELKERESTVHLHTHKARQIIDELSKRNLFFRAQNKELSLQNDQLCATVCSFRDVSAKQRLQVTRCRALFLVFLQWTRLSCKRIYFLSAQLHDLQHRFSALVSAHLELRRRHIGLTDTHTISQNTVQVLREELDSERRSHLLLKAETEQIAADLSVSTEKSTTLQHSLEIITERYDGLQESFAELLFSHNHLKGDCSKLRGDLKQAFLLVQATQDVAQLGLSSMSSPSTARPLKVKQDFMRIAQLLDLVRLNVADTVGSLGSLIGAEEEQPQMTIQSPTLPGSVEDNVRKLQIICGIPRDA